MGLSFMKGEKGKAHQTNLMWKSNENSSLLTNTAVTAQMPICWVEKVKSRCAVTALPARGMPSLAPLELHRLPLGKDHPFP